MIRLRSVWILASMISVVACGSSDPGIGTGGQGQGGSQAGDGDGDGDGDSGDADALEPYLPWEEGNTWTYQVTAAGVTSTKVTTVEPLEAVGGTGPNADLMANRVRTEKGADLTISWQLLVSDGVMRYREQAFSASTGDLALEEHWDPHKIHFDETPEHTAADATWLEEYEETKLPVGGAPVTAIARDRWTVIAVDQEVTVPAGTFSTIVLTKAGGNVLKTYYYARGVGKVKEEGTQLEELVSYEVAP